MIDFQFLVLLIGKLYAAARAGRGGPVPLRKFPMKWICVILSIEVAAVENRSISDFPPCHGTESYNSRGGNFLLLNQMFLYFESPSLYQMFMHCTASFN